MLGYVLPGAVLGVVVYRAGVKRGWFSSAKGRGGRGRGWGMSQKRQHANHR